MSIAENIAQVRANIAAAAKEAGRDPGEITLVGASKMNDAAACREAIAAGIDVLGENRVQEMTQKLSEQAYDGAPLHFIGHLQRNKVKQVVGHVAMIQSVGSLALLDEIEKVAAAKGRTSCWRSTSARRRPRAASLRRSSSQPPRKPGSGSMSGCGD